MAASWLLMHLHGSPRCRGSRPSRGTVEVRGPCSTIPFMSTILIATSVQPSSMACIHRHYSSQICPNLCSLSSTTAACRSQGYDRNCDLLNPAVINVSALTNTYCVTSYCCYARDDHHNLKTVKCTKITNSRKLVKKGDSLQRRDAWSD